MTDTNVLLRLSDRRDPQHPAVRTALRERRLTETSLFFTPQNAMEYWNVATRPVDRNGFGFSTVAADRMLPVLERLFPVLPDVPAIYPEWRRLIRTYHVSGVQVHDARPAAAMIVLGLSRILTCDSDDFLPYAQ